MHRMFKVFVIKHVFFYLCCICLFYNHFLHLCAHFSLLCSTANDCILLFLALLDLFAYLDWEDGLESLWLKWLLLARIQLLYAVLFLHANVDGCVGSYIYFLLSRLKAIFCGRIILFILGPPAIFCENIILFFLGPPTICCDLIVLFFLEPATFCDLIVLFVLEPAIFCDLIVLFFLGPPATFCDCRIILFFLGPPATFCDLNHCRACLSIHCFWIFLWLRLRLKRVRPGHKYVIALLMPLRLFLTVYNLHLELICGSDRGASLTLSVQKASHVLQHTRYLSCLLPRC